VCCIPYGNKEINKEEEEEEEEEEETLKAWL
jgi:hypothetical protein